MDLVINLLRILTAVVAPIVVIVFILMTAIKVSKAKGALPEEGQNCLRCGESRKGAEGQLYYTEPPGSLSGRNSKRRLIPGSTPILGNETHFICDQCVFRYVRNEIFQMILMVLPYPLYLFLFIPRFAENGVFANFLVETLLIVLSIGGLISAINLLRAVRMGGSLLIEVRDRVAIHERKNSLGKKFYYYTRTGALHLK